MKYHFKVRKEGKWFWAQCIEFPGCVTQGTSMHALHKNMEEALNLYIEEPEDSKERAVLPHESIHASKSIVEVAVDPQSAFAFMMRYQALRTALLH
jgi:predicted RNase H-like HicB family nuclease